ncbi:hypothetical protein FisN_18Lh243 [Fistulifera solaris]|uniref:Tyrosine specific protein phosphatases domain-containing protein n=1 Tax=Fistulifera solaris TaxID=1519565 RepID=A0A1Z5JUI3_FISSO|nr:hypothetical protein FisN_18Lh243 [Fistulifera solaris]|eukprot:GAX17589.1 hypothetical protein FisN_18Lh243 [Fistulifera solaris]
MIQFLFVFLALELSSFTTLRNFRPIITPNVFRSAALDELSQTEAQILYDSLRSGLILDLRNQDEMEKSQSKATEGSQWFYDELQVSHTLTRIHLPILQSVDEFWDVTISYMPLWTRVTATAQTIVQAGALDRAAARYLESQGLFGLYRSMLESGGPAFNQGLHICLQSKGPVLVHCQKGKDRTGLLSMMLQHCAGATREEIIEAYSLSEQLLGPDRQQIRAGNSNNDYIDWNLFRGSPAQAMIDTLDWMDCRYGSIDGYLDSIGFNAEHREAWKNKCARYRSR